MRVKINDNLGLTVTAILPYRHQKQIQVIRGKQQTHIANREGKLLLSVDNLDQEITFADPSVTVEHKLDGMVQTFKGCYTKSLR